MQILLRIAQTVSSRHAAGHTPAMKRCWVWLTASTTNTIGAVVCAYQTDARVRGRVVVLIQDMTPRPG
jgi:hypothetical protein